MTRIVSVSTALFDGYPMEVAAGEIARAGGRYVEPAFIKGYVDFDETAFSSAKATRLGAIVGQEGLSIHSLSAHLDLSATDAPEALRRRIEFAARLGASFLITNSGPVEQRETIRRTIDAVLPVLEDVNLTIALENPGHGSANLTGCVAAAADFIRQVGSQHVRLNHDAGNVFTYSNEGMQPADDIAVAPDLVSHVHLKDVASSPAGWTFCALGDGAVDFEAYFRCLGKDTPVGIELPLRLERRDRNDPKRSEAVVEIGIIRKELVRSLKFIERLETRSDSSFPIHDSDARFDGV